MLYVTIIIINDSAPNWTDVLTALGTVLAVILSLFFSLQKSKVKIDVDYYIYKDDLSYNLEERNICPILIINAIARGEGTTQVACFFVENEKKVKLKEYVNDSGEYFYFGKIESYYDDEFKITRELVESKKIRFGIRELAKNKEYTSEWIIVESFIREFTTLPIDYLSKKCTK